VSATSDTARRDAIDQAVVDVLREMTSDWDLELSGGIGPASRLADDLGCESLDVVMLIVALEERFGVAELPWNEALLVDGEVVEDLTVADVCEFLARHLPRNGPGR
jgi:acyl carrier protein